MMQAIVAAAPQIMEYGKKGLQAISSIMNKMGEQGQGQGQGQQQGQPAQQPQQQQQVGGGKFYYPTSGYKGISGVIEQLGKGTGGLGGLGGK